MNRDQVLQEFKDAEAILEGHFILSSGLRSSIYMQCARVMIDAKRGERLCKVLADLVKQYMKNSGQYIDCIISPAMGGVVVGYELARQLDMPGMFCERVEGAFQLRRGFALEKGAKVLIVEDVVTTGKSSMEAVECVKANGGEAVAVASLVDRRSSSDSSLILPLISLLKMDIKSYKPEDVPAELAAIPAIKPGSRGLK